MLTESLEDSFTTGIVARIAPDGNPADVERANPAAYVTKKSPPIYTSHGTTDPLVPY
jgi:hypothetical protein